MYLLIGFTILFFAMVAISAWFEGLSERPERRITVRKHTLHSGRVGKGNRKFEKPI